MAYHGGARILVVDDSVLTLEVIQRNLSAAGYDVYTAASVHQAVDFLEHDSVDLVITDIKMPKISGLELLKYVKENLKDTEIMIITGYPSVKGAVEAVKDGAKDYLVKPFTDEELLAAVAKMLEKQANRQAAEVKVFPANDSIIGNSVGMQKVYKLIGKAAKTKVNVLITGESGTGKELVARAIHYNSPERSGPFVPVNCTAIPDTLLESELFGHVKGAFTGASTSRAGFFQIADGGTLFLDEIGDISLKTQVDLLRVLQRKEFRRLGGQEEIKVDVRILAATNRDLKTAISENKFREDLFYRLNVISIPVPPLRNRKDDIPLLVKAFIRRYCLEMNKDPVKMTPSALNLLMDYNWPGNVRELENVIERALVIGRGKEIVPEDLPFSRKQVGPEKMPNSLKLMEKMHIKRILEETHWNISKTARLLEIDRQTLYNKIAKYTIEKES